MRLIFACIFVFAWNALVVNSSIGAGPTNLNKIKEFKNSDNQNTMNYRLFGGLGGSNNVNLDEATFSLGPLNTLLGLDTETGTFAIENASLVILGIVILIPLTIGLALLFYLIGGSGDAALTGYTTLRRTSDLETTARYDPKSFNPHFIDWETFTILDWIAIAEETWKKFEPSNLECQKRLICEVHQNAPKFGRIAKKMVDAFSYLQYAEVLRLPEDLKNLVHSYLDAADRGRSMKKECGEIYDTCDFSVKKMVDKVSHNEI